MQYIEIVSTLKSNTLSKREGGTWPVGGQGLLGVSGGSGHKE